MEVQRIPKRTVSVIEPQKSILVDKEKYHQKRVAAYQKLGKDLATVDELAVLDGSKCILQLRGVRPFLSKKFDITQHKNYRYLSDANPKNEFDIEKFLSHRLKPKQDEAYHVFEVDVSEADEAAGEQPAFS